jgi:hypothetical protein
MSPEVGIKARFIEVPQREVPLVDAVPARRCYHGCCTGVPQREVPAIEYRWMPSY